MSPGNLSLVGAGSVVMQRPYLSICRKNQQKKKPQNSKLSILSKMSMGSTKVTSQEYKKRASSKDSKSIRNVRELSKQKTKSNSCKQKLGKTIKVQRLGLSCEPEYFSKLMKHTPVSRTVHKRQETNSVSPLYSSLIFNSAQSRLSPENGDKNLAEILEKTFHILSAYKQSCTYLRKKKNFYKQKYFLAENKLKKILSNGQSK